MQKTTQILIMLSTLFILAYAANASYVTLTASCSNINIRNNSAYINFTIVNSGNGNATNLVLAPAATGLQSSNVNNIAVLYPSNKSTVYFGIPKPIYYGNYGFGVNVAYTQDQQTFMVSFPCEVSYVNNSISTLVINNLSEENNIVTAHVTNIGNFPINATAYFIVPTSFNISKNASSINVQPSSTYTIKSKIHYYAMNMTLPIALFVSYIKNNVSYTSMATTSISIKSSAQQFPSLIIIFFIAVIAIIVILIVISLLVKKKKRSKKQETD